MAKALYDRVKSECELSDDEIVIYHGHSDQKVKQMDFQAAGRVPPSFHTTRARKNAGLVKVESTFFRTYVSQMR